ncbi:MAG: TPM domain-containing protein, partial [Gemmatimonadota bacterium]
MSTRLRIGLVAALFAAVPPLEGQLQLPEPVGYVNDFANVIPAAERQQIESIIDEVRAKSGGEIVVVTLPTLGGRSRDEVGLQIGREWQIGQSGAPGDRARNTGSVVLVVPSEREWKIETGLGTMTFITAAEAGRIGRDLMVPHFPDGNFGQGILMAVAALAQAYADEFDFQITGEIPELPEPSGGDGDRPNLTLIFVVLLLLYFFFANRRG